MKSIKLFSVVILSFFFLTSCTKDEMKDVVNQTLQNSSISVGFQVAGVPVQLSLGGGTGLYYPASAYSNYICPTDPNYYSNFSNVTVCYIKSAPRDQTNIVVVDRSGNPIPGTVSLSSGDWQADNLFFLKLKNFNYGNNWTEWYEVVSRWDPKWTSGMWNGHI